MHTWHWHNWQGLPYLTCSLLQPWTHGFFTRLFSPRSPAELTTVLQSSASPYRVRQVHGNVVLTPSEVEIVSLMEATTETLPLPDADGLVTEKPDQAVWVSTADCVPVLIADVRTGHVAAVHAGWRGTAAAIVPQAILRLQKQGSQLADLRVALGPAIAGEVYQVSTTVAAEVGQTIVSESADSEESTDPETVLTVLRELPDSPLLIDTQLGRVRLDVRRVNALQLERLGIQAEQVAIAPHCTYRDAEFFFSYRREHLKKVQWSGIVSLDPGT
jgi:polyphenol oxidase